MKSKNISIASDHAGFQMKSQLKAYLENKGYTLIDYGPTNENSVDYPDHIHPAVQAIENNLSGRAVLLCGSGQGAAITANKHQSIRAALVWSKEVATLARQHNNANVLVLPARFVSLEEAQSFVDVFLETPFEGGRHQTRVDKIPCASS